MALKSLRVTKTGTNRDDTLTGGPGDDKLDGRGGNDLLDGGPGRDWLIGGAGHDRLFGRAGNDAMSGGSGNDRLDGGDGNDRLYGLRGNDLLFGGNGNDRIDGGAGNDRMAGGAGDDLLIGTAGGVDRFEGNTGNDTMILGSTLPAKVDGGTGFDRANLDALGSSIDLSGALGARFDDLEILDLGGSKANTLKLSAATVLSIAGGGGGPFLDGALLVNGDVGDRVDLDGTWINTSIVSNPFGEIGTYLLYTNGTAQVLVDSEIAVVPGTPAKATIDLGALDGINGFTIVGEDQLDTSGASVSAAGDINGDGFTDLIVGAPRAVRDGGAYGEGASYVVFGKASWVGTPALDLGTLDGTNGFRLTGFGEYDSSGFSVSSAGDVNGDGFADVIIGAPGATSPGGGYNEGESYVVFGKANWAGTPSVDLSSLNGTNGFTLSGIDAGDNTSFVASAGDVNGDGLDDVIIGSTSAESDADLEGESYIVFGKASWAGTPSLDLATLDGTNGLRLTGVDAFDLSGHVSSAGDVNGDGFADVIIGAPDAENEEGFGESYVVFGKASWAGTPSLDLATLDGINGFRLTGRGGFAGASVSSAGDVNGDGFADVIVGAPTFSPAGEQGVGESYVVFGKANWAATPSLDLETLDGTNGFRLDGIDSFDQAGSVSSAGDVNGDGFDDIIIGAVLAEGAGGLYDEGESYVVYGKASWVGVPSVDLAALDGTNGFHLVGVDSFDQAGAAVSSAGDVNGDGFGDLIIGAANAESAGGEPGEGESYVVFGGNFTGAVTHLGSAGNDKLTGSAAAETFVGGGGDDTLEGSGGADAFQGGSGDDVMKVASLDFLVVAGGTGFDTLALGGSGLNLDLTALADSRTRSIEHIDIRGAGSNTVTLSVGDILNLSDESNEVRISGTAGDTVETGAGWSAAASGGTNGNGTSTIDGETYQIYSAGNATLLVDTDVTTTA